MQNFLTTLWCTDVILLHLRKTGNVCIFKTAPLHSQVYKYLDVASIFSHLIESSSEVGIQVYYVLRLSWINEGADLTWPIVQLLFSL